MRIAVLLLVALSVAPPVAAQGMIEWSSVRRLTKDDFRGRVPSSIEHASQSWLNIDATWECKNGALIVSARAMFDPARSWWRPTFGNVWEGAGERSVDSSRTQLDVRKSAAQRDLQLLEHEQLHFDLTELAVRKILAHFTSATSACTEPDGTAGFQPFVAQVDRDLQDEQREYDRDTAHGTSQVTQAYWTNRVRKLLQPR